MFDDVFQFATELFVLNLGIKFLWYLLINDRNESFKLIISIS